MARVFVRPRFDSDRGRISTAGSRPGWRVASCGSPRELAKGPGYYRFIPIPDSAELLQSQQGEMSQT
eukprot:366564-Chlamydomonas_euryale.AAC.20